MDRSPWCRSTPVRRPVGGLWESLSEPWRVCLEEAWGAYCAGSLPIGAAVAGAGGRVLARGRNRIFESEPSGRTLFGRRLAHAEVNALVQLDHAAVDPRTCTLYTTTEPCPLCVGAVQMCLVGEVRYAARDPAAGSAALLEASPFMRRGGVRVVGPERADLETVAAALLFAWALREGHTTWVATHLEATLPDAAALGRVLHAEGRLADLARTARPAADVVDAVARRGAGADGRADPAPSAPGA